MFVAGAGGVGIPRGSIRATVLIETILAAFEMDEILYELRDHAAGLNAGRWDYIFSIIKKFRDRPDVRPARPSAVTMAVPFMRAYTQLLVRTCHRRGAHAIGGMAAFIPNRREPEVTANALARVREDKEREAGRRIRRDVGRPSRTWCRSPARSSTGVLGERPNQKDRLREDVSVDAGELLDMAIPGGAVTEAGVRARTSASALRYLDAWLARQRRRGDRQPHGGRRDGRDQPLPAVAVAPPRDATGRWPPGQRRALRSDPRRGVEPQRRARRGPPRRRRRPARSRWS